MPDVCSRETWSFITLVTETKQSAMAVRNQAEGLYIFFCILVNDVTRYFGGMQGNKTFPVGYWLLIGSD